MAEVAAVISARRIMGNPPLVVKLKRSKGGNMVTPYMLFIRLGQNKDGEKLHNLVHIDGTREWMLQWDSLYKLRDAARNDRIGHAPFNAWGLAVQDKAPEEAAKYADWEETGYSVLVKLDRRGYPTGPIFVAYAFCRHDGFEAEEIEWRDEDDRELPHIRRLYEGCNIQFYLAQIANGIEDLKHGKEFNFDVKCFDRCTVQGAKVVGFNPTARVVPREVYDDMGEDRRAK